MRKHRMSKRGSKKLFRATAMKTHKKNLVKPSRGGLRM